MGRSEEEIMARTITIICIIYFSVIILSLLCHKLHKVSEISFLALLYIFSIFILCLIGSDCVCIGKLIIEVDVKKNQNTNDLFIVCILKTVC